jgi:ethanolamine ammonia-lyase large subunit
VVDKEGKPTTHFGDPLWVYLQYRKLKKDPLPDEMILAQGRLKMKEVRDRGVWLAEGAGKNPWDLQASLDTEIRRLYADAKQTLWSEFSESWVLAIPGALAGRTMSVDRKDYVWHPPTGEKVSGETTAALQALRTRHQGRYNVLIVVSDGLCANALSDTGHLEPYLALLRTELNNSGYRTAPEHVVLRQGRVRAGYQVGELVYGGLGEASTNRAIIHVIGERPGSGHHTFSTYITAPTAATWTVAGKVDHNITKVVSGIADTAFAPTLAAPETVRLLRLLAPPV